VKNYTHLFIQNQLEQQQFAHIFIIYVFKKTISWKKFPNRRLHRNNNNHTKQRRFRSLYVCSVFQYSGL
jgi:hypothetical protein